MPVGNRAHASDPRASGAFAPSAGRRCGVWRSENAERRQSRTCGYAARLPAPGAARGEARIRASGRRQEDQRQRRAPRRHGSADHRAARRCNVARRRGSEAESALTPTAADAAWSAAEAAAWVLPSWPAPGSIHALTTTRQLPGNSLPPFDAFNLGLRSGENSGIVLANRALLGRGCALPSPPRWLHQVHGTRSLHLTAEALDGEPDADAAFTAQPGVVLAVVTADCLPILVCADDGGEIAAVHAGWRGLANGVIESCIGRLRSAPEKLLVWLGPAIGATS